MSRLAGLLPGFPDVRLVVALSGGVDSSVLLAALSAQGVGRQRRTALLQGSDLQFAGLRLMARGAGGQRRTGALAKAARVGGSQLASSRITGRRPVVAGRTASAPGDAGLVDLHVRAVHVNHGIHPNAAKWAAHCRELGRRLGVDVCVLKARVVSSPGVSLEAAARDARYALLAGELEPGECLLTGHHEDDQLETVLLQLFRGAGLAGLAAMPAITSFAGGSLARPLLSRSRGELEDWARGAGLTWVDDDTNADESLDRNYLRRQVLPLIRERWKGVGLSVSRSARHAAQGQRLLDALARTDVERASSGPALFVPTLRALQPDRRRNALRFWIMQRGARVPDTSRLEELAGPLIDARPDANPTVAWGEVEVRRHADLLTLSGAVGHRHRAQKSSGGGDGPHRGPGEGASTRGSRDATRSKDGSSSVEWAWKTAPHLELPGGRGTLELKADPHGPIDMDVLPDRVTVSQRRGGERLRPRRGGSRRSLKSLLQESHLPIAQRGRLPLVFSGVLLLAVGSLWVDESIQVTPGARRRARLIHAAPAS